MHVSLAFVFQMRIGDYSITSWMLFGKVKGFNHMVDPCKLICHMEYTIDLCKLVFADGIICRNAFWTDDNKDAMVVDIVIEDDAIPVSIADAVALLRAPKGGCEKLCKSHESCIETGSNCKENDTCLNLFWNRGRPVKEKMTTCHSLDLGADCPDVTPVLCGKFLDIESLIVNPPPVSDQTELVDTSEHNNTQLPVRSGAVTRWSLLWASIVVASIILQALL